MPIPNEEAWRRIKAAVKRVESQMRREIAHRQKGGIVTGASWALVKITEEQDAGDSPGVYKAIEVIRQKTIAGDAEYVELPDGRVFDDEDPAAEPSIYELNGTTGIPVDKVVEVRLRAIDVTDSPSEFNRPAWWTFTIGGGTDVVPVKILGKVEAPNNPDEDRWYCEVYPDGKHGDPLPQTPPLDGEEPTVDYILYMLTIDTGVTLPNGQMWTLAIRRGDVDSMIDTPHASTPGFHYEGQIPLWFCEP